MPLADDQPRTSVEWAHALSRTAAIGRDADVMLTTRTIRDVFGATVAWSADPAEALFDVSTSTDGSTCWTVRPPARAAPVELDPVASRAVADRALLALAAVAVGTGQRALVLARKRAGKRTVAGRPLIEMQSTGHRLAHAAARLAVARVSVLSASRDEDSGLGAGHRAPAVAAAAAEAAFAASYALVQVYGAAGTSDEAPVAAFAACQAAAADIGPPAELWLEAARRRGLGGTAALPLA